jgi:hypothetical protein
MTKMKTEIYDRQDHFLVTAEKCAVRPQPRQHLVRAQQSHRPQDAQETAGLSGERRQK